jgi:hypothetical protein
MDPSWQDILNERPKQFTRVLVRLQGGNVRITSYDMYAYEHWPITHWKQIPDEQRQHTDIP